MKIACLGTYKRCLHLIVFTCVNKFIDKFFKFQNNFINKQDIDILINEASTLCRMTNKTHTKLINYSTMRTLDEENN